MTGTESSPYSGMQSPVDSTASALTTASPSSLPSTVPSALSSPTSNIQTASTSIFQPASTSSPTSNIPTASTSIFQPASTSNIPPASTSIFHPASTSSFTSNIPTASTSIFQPTSTSSSTSNIPTASASIFQPASPSTPVSATEITASTSANNAGVSPAFWAAISSQLDPEQLTFHIGPSTSPNKGYSARLPSSVTITPVPSSSARPSTNTGLFGSEIVAEASRAPGRFKFQTAPATAVRRLAGQPRDSGTAPSRSTDTSAPRYISQVGSFGQSQRTQIPVLGPDVVIRPVSSQSRKNTYEASSKQNAHPGLQDPEMFQLQAGYRYLKEEVASLKVQLGNSQALMQEILSNFSSEIAKINIRLTAVEQGRRHAQGNKAEKRTEHDRKGNVEEMGESNENGDRGCLSTELENLTISKEKNDK